MFVSFRDALGGGVGRAASFPPMVIDELSKGLPQGLSYRSLGDGTLYIVPEEGHDLSFGGFTVEVTDDMKKVLGEDPSLDDVFNYSYNAQKPLRMALLDSGHIVINGQPIPVDQFALSPNHDVRLEDGEIYACPASFPPPFDVALSADGGKMKMSVSMQRVPDESVDTHRFESDAEAPIAIRCAFTEPAAEDRKASMSFDVSANPSRCASLEEVVALLTILKSISEGTCSFGGIPLGCPDDGSGFDGVDAEVLLTMKMALAVESALGLGFDPREIVLSSDAGRTVAELYGGLVLGVAVRRSQPSVTLELKESEVDHIEEALAGADGGKLAIRYSMPCSFELFGEKIALQSLCGVFDLVASGVETDENGARTLVLESERGSSGGYLSRLLFEDEKSLDAYEAEAPDTEIMRRLQEGRAIEDILGEEV